MRLTPEEKAIVEKALGTFIGSRRAVVGHAESRDVGIPERLERWRYEAEVAESALANLRTEMDL
jgi:hypothetical protein